MLTAGGVCSATETRHLDLLGQLGEVEQDSNTDSEQENNTDSPRRGLHCTPPAWCGATKHQSRSVVVRDLQLLASDQIPSLQHIRAARPARRPRAEQQCRRSMLCGTRLAFVLRFCCSEDSQGGTPAETGLQRGRLFATRPRLLEQTAVPSLPSSFLDLRPPAEQRLLLAQARSGAMRSSGWGLLVSKCTQTWRADTCVMSATTEPAPTAWRAPARQQGRQDAQSARSNAQWPGTTDTCVYKAPATT